MDLLIWFVAISALLIAGWWWYVRHPRIAAEDEWVLPPEPDAPPAAASVPDAARPVSVSDAAPPVREVLDRDALLTRDKASIPLEWDDSPDPDGPVLGVSVPDAAPPVREVLDRDALLTRDKASIPLEWDDSEDELSSGADAEPPRVVGGREVLDRARLGKQRVEFDPTAWDDSPDEA